MTNSFAGKTEKFLPAILIALLSIIWGSSFILIKKGLDSFSAVQVGSLRIVFACLALLPLALKHIRHVSMKKLGLISFSGFAGTLIPAILFSLAEEGIGSGLTGILNSLTPLFTLIVGALLFRYEMKLVQLLGIILGFAGCAGLSFVNNQGALGNFNHFALYVIIATFLYGINGNFIKKYLSDFPPHILASLALLSIGPAALILLLSGDFFHRLATIEGAWMSAFYIFLLGAAGTALAMALFNKLLYMTTPVFASIVTYTIPIVAVLWGILDGESFFTLHLAGMGLIILGVLIVNKNR